MFRVVGDRRGDVSPVYQDNGHFSVFFFSLSCDVVLIEKVIVRRLTLSKQKCKQKNDNNRNKKMPLNSKSSPLRVDIRNILITDALIFDLYVFSLSVYWIHNKAASKRNASKITITFHFGFEWHSLLKVILLLNSFKSI